MLNPPRSSAAGTTASIREAAPGKPAGGANLEQARWLAPAAALAATVMGVGLQISSGTLQGDAMRCMVVAFVLVVFAVITPRPHRFARLDRGTVLFLALVGLFVQVGLLAASAPASYVFVYQATQLPFYWGAAALAALAGAFLWAAPRRAKPLTIGAMVLTHFLVGLSAIRSLPTPTIDVYVYHRQSIEALLSGTNPYAITFPDIYDSDVSAQYYGPGASVNKRLQFGFPYFPLSLLVALPGQLIVNDSRYAQLVAVEVAAILMACARAEGFGTIAAALFLTTPRMFFVLAWSWTEPFVVLGLAALVFASCRDSRATPWLFGAFVALKQYLVFALLAIPLLVTPPFNRRRLTSFLGKGAVVGIAVTLPFVLWGPGAFWRSVVALQFHQPFRRDSLSLLSWWAARGHAQLSPLVGLVAASMASGLALWRLPRTPSGFSAAIAVTYFAFFIFNKQAFCNYYFFVVGALCVMLAAVDTRPGISAT